MREKLIDLMYSAMLTRENDRLMYGEARLTLEELADYLISHGVTLAEDNNVPTKWIPVSERLPKESGYYLVHHKGGFVSERYFYEDAPEIFAQVRNSPVTHWMPLPEPPKEVT